MSIQTRQTRPFNNNNNSTRFPNPNYSQSEMYCNDENLESPDHLFKENESEEEVNRDTNDFLELGPKEIRKKY